MSAFFTADRIDFNRLCRRPEILVVVRALIPLMTTMLCLRNTLLSRRILLLKGTGGPTVHVDDSNITLLCILSRGWIFHIIISGMGHLVLLNRVHVKHESIEVLGVLLALVADLNHLVIVHWGAVVLARVLQQGI